VEVLAPWKEGVMKSALEQYEDERALERPMIIIWITAPSRGRKDLVSRCIDARRRVSHWMRSEHPAALNKARQTLHSLPEPLRDGVLDGSF